MWPTPYTPIFSNTPAGVEQIAPLVVAASTTTSAASPLPGNTNGDGSNPDISIENTTNGWAFCNFGDSSVPAATLNNGVGVPPGSVRIVRVQPGTTSVTVILNTGATSGPVRFLRGAGIT
jgi:hypothetical protein